MNLMLCVCSKLEMQGLIVDYLNGALTSVELGMLEDPMKEFSEGEISLLSRWLAGVTYWSR